MTELERKLSKELEEVRRIFIDSHAKENAENKMNELINKYAKLIDDEDELTNKTKEILKGLITFILNRNK